MINTIIIIFIFINIFSIVVKKNTKIIDYLSLIFFVFISSCSKEYADYGNYLFMYNNNEIIKQIGLKFTMKIANVLSLTYNQYLILIITICYVMIFYIIKKLAPNRSMVYLLYFIYPYFLDIIQLKNFIAESFLVFSIGILILNKKKFKSFFIYLCSLGFHEAFILYLPNWFIKKRILKKLIIISFIFFTGIFISFYLKFEILGKLIFFLPKWKIKSYTDQIARIGWIIPLGYQLISFYIIKVMLKKFIEVSDKKYKIFKELDKVLTYSLIFLGLYYINGTFERLYRNLWIFNYIIASNYYIYSKNKKKIILLFLWILLVGYYYIGARELYIPILQNNIILK